jgi:hypothetical protein
MNVKSMKWKPVTRIGTTGHQKYIGEIVIDIFCNNQKNAKVRLYDVIENKKIFSVDLGFGYNKIRRIVRRLGAFEVQIKGKNINLRGIDTANWTFGRLFLTDEG